MIVTPTFSRAAKEQRHMNAVSRLDLAGTWSFTPYDDSGQPTTPTSIQVPGGGWVKQGFAAEAGLYATMITIPQVLDRQVSRLELGAVNHEAHYYLGRDQAEAVLIHCEVTSFTEQVVDLTKWVEPGQSYWLGIEVWAYRNGRPVAPRNWQEKSAGIPRGLFRSAHLAVYPPVFIDDITVRTTTQPAQLSWEATVVNSLDEPATVTLEADLSSWNGADWPYPALAPASHVIPAHTALAIDMPSVDWTAPPPSYWRPNLPYQPGYRAQLHTLRVTAQAVSQSADPLPSHVAQRRFGFRQVAQADEHFTLNGTVIRFRGDSLQVANYDTIDYQGRGDAIDTLPGFLPPSDTCGGWPEAVDNMLRLNFNLQRAHRQPWSPYMLDVCDELGLMVMGEAADGWEEFDHAFHEMKTLADMIRRDRNHPSIVRWSLKNEPLSVDPTYHRELYDTVKRWDSTRPICEGITLWEPNIYDPYKVYALLLDEPDFTWIEQFLTYDDDGVPFYSAARHNNAARPIPGRPYGLGGGLWPQCSTQAGLIKFATCIARVRADGADEVRPYTLVSGWVAQIPGVRTDQVRLEELRRPVYGADNLPQPWHHPAIKLIQQVCSPVFAVDYDFLVANEESNPAGAYPVVIPTIQARAPVRRRIVVLNDELDGRDLVLEWSVHTESRANDCFAGGQVPLIIAPGSGRDVEIEFLAPDVNSPVFLTLQVYKDGTVRFSDNLTTFQVSGGREYGYWGQPDNMTVPERWLGRQLQPWADIPIAAGPTP